MEKLQIVKEFEELKTDKKKSSQIPELKIKPTNCWYCEDIHLVDGMPCSHCRPTEYRAVLLEQKNLAEYGRRFTGKSLKDFIVRDESTKKALMAVNEYLAHLPENIERGQGLTIIGPVGVGKTHLIVGLKKAAGEQDVRFAMVNALNIIIECKDAMDKNTSVSDVMKRYAEQPCLILDDFGADKNKSDWAGERWYYLLNERYVHCRTTIITSNLRFSEIQEALGFYGQRVVSRIMEMNGPAIALISSDFRAQEVKKTKGA